MTHPVLRKKKQHAKLFTYGIKQKRLEVNTMQTGKLQKFATCLILSVIMAVLSFSAAETVETIEPVSIELNSGAVKGAALTSLNAGFTSPAGNWNLVMCGLAEEQKASVLSALSQSFDPDAALPLKLIDSAFTDAEKYSKDSERDIDSGLCWAGSVSNLLWMSGWAKEFADPRTGRTFTSEDDVFDYYFASFTNHGVEYITSAVDWFFMGEYYNLTYSQGASLYEDNNPADGLCRDFVSSLAQERIDMIRDPQQIERLFLCDWTRENASVFQASIGGLLGDELGESEHSVTVVGIITDPSASSWKDLYKAILIVDSDNDVAPEDEGSEERPDDAVMLASRKARPNSVTVYPLKFAADCNNTPYWQIVHYGSDSDTCALYRMHRLLVYNPALMDAYRETEGSRNVHTQVDLTLESLFTTDSTEPFVDMFGVEKDEVVQDTFASGAPVNLNFFIVNRSGFDLDESVRQGKELSVSWTVARDADGAVVASGQSACPEILPSRLEVGFLVCLNEADGETLAWDPGTYTVTLELNRDRSITEAYYLNNIPLKTAFTVR